MQEQELLILGAGWTATFLIPLLRQHKRRFAATTTSGHEVAGTKTIKYKYDPDADDAVASLKALPLAQTVLITFPLNSVRESRFLVETYNSTHSRKQGDVHYIQLGSTGIWQIPQEKLWTSRRSPYNTTNSRAIAEDELLRLGGTVLNLAGLWGGKRNVKHWLDRIAKSKDELKGKTSLHMVHGIDVSRGIEAVMDNWEASKSQRWMVTDGFVYDWYALVAGWADLPADESHPPSTSDGQQESQKIREPREQAKWVLELMVEERVQALPRSMEALKRCYDSREFWSTFGLVPLRARLS